MIAKDWLLTVTVVSVLGAFLYWFFRTRSWESLPNGVWFEVLEVISLEKENSLATVRPCHKVSDFLVVRLPRRETRVKVGYFIFTSYNFDGSVRFNIANENHQEL